jgi:CrcB protein
MMNVVLVMAGGAAGSAARYWVGTLLPVSAGTFPMPTFLVNLVGSFVLGLLVGHGMSERPAAPSLQLLLGTGFCGGFTTYSAFAVESVSLLQRGDVLVVTTYVLATLCGCALSAALGIILTRP